MQGSGGKLNHSISNAILPLCAEGQLLYSFSYCPTGGSFVFMFS